MTQSDQKALQFLQLFSVSLHAKFLQRGGMYRHLAAAAAFAIAVLGFVLHGPLYPDPIEKYALGEAGKQWTATCQDDMEKHAQNFKAGQTLPFGCACVAGELQSSFGATPSDEWRFAQDAWLTMIVREAADDRAEGEKAAIALQRELELPTKALEAHRERLVNALRACHQAYIKELRG